MEEASLGAFAFLIQVILLAAIGAGVVTIVVAGFAKYRPATVGGPTTLPESSFLERSTVGVCALISLLSLVVAVQSIRLDGATLRGRWRLSVLLVVAIILSGLPAILWKTRLRWPAEGIASIALAVAAVLSMFSIGLFFVPLVVLMTWICIQHVRVVNRLYRQPLGLATETEGSSG
jgi:hypothetical protein